MSKRKKASKEPEVDDGRETFSITVVWSKSRIEVEGWRFGSVGVHYGATPGARFTHIPSGACFALIEAPHGYILRAARIVNAEVDLSSEDMRETAARLKAWVGSAGPLTIRDIATKMVSLLEIPFEFTVCIHDAPPKPEPKKGRRSTSRRKNSEPAA